MRPISSSGRISESKDTSNFLVSSVALVSKFAEGPISTKANFETARLEQSFDHAVEQKPSAGCCRQPVILQRQKALFGQGGNLCGIKACAPAFLIPRKIK